MFFQGLYLLAHRRLADEQRLPGLGKAELPGNFKEDFVGLGKHGGEGT